MRVSRSNQADADRGGPRRPTRKVPSKSIGVTCRARPTRRSRGAALLSDDQGSCPIHVISIKGQDDVTVEHRNAPDEIHKYRHDFLNDLDLFNDEVGQIGEQRLIGLSVPTDFEARRGLTKSLNLFGSGIMSF
jgi:hypothetical protein